MVQRVVVIGGGSAGFLAAISLKIKIPDLDVSVVRSKDMGVIGAHAGAVNAVLASPSSNSLYSAGDDGLLKSWKLPVNPVDAMTLPISSRMRFTSDKPIS